MIKIFKLILICLIFSACVPVFQDVKLDNKINLKPSHERNIYIDSEPFKSPLYASDDIPLIDRGGSYNYGRSKSMIYLDFLGRLTQDTTGNFNYDSTAQKLNVPFATTTMQNSTLMSPVVSGTVTGSANYTGVMITNPTSTNGSFANPAITGTVTGGANYTAPTITNPAFSGTSTGSITIPNLISPSLTSTGIFTTNDVVTKGPWVDARTSINGQPGMTCNGVTDDNPALLRAINSLPASGGKVLIPCQMFAVSSALILTNKSGVTIEGLSNGLVGLGQTSGTRMESIGNGTVPMVYFNGVRDVYFKNILLDGNSVSNQICLKIDWDGVQTVNTTDDHYENFGIRGCAIGIDIGNTSDLAASEQFFSHFEIINNTTGVRIQGGNTLNIHFDHGSITGNGVPGDKLFDVIKGDLWLDHVVTGTASIGINVSLNVDSIHTAHVRDETTDQFLVTPIGASSARTPITLIDFYGLGSSTANYIYVPSNFYLTILASTIRGATSRVNYSPQATQITNGMNQFIDIGNTWAQNSPTVAAGARWIQFSEFGAQNYLFNGVGATFEKQITSTLPTGTPAFTTTSMTASSLAISTNVLYGTTTNNNACAGCIGEFISSTVASPGPSMSNGIPANITSISLTGGQWEVWGIVNFVPAATTTISSISSAINTVSATLPTDGSYTGFNTTFTTGAGQYVPTVRKRISLAGTTTVYLIGQISFGTSTCTAFGQIYATRVW